jgi:hypothetical protein
MARDIYTPELRQRFIAVATEARANDRGWDEALMPAKQEGYKGGLPGLKKLIRESETSSGIITPKRGPGRPRKSASDAPGIIGGLSDVERA